MRKECVRQSISRRLIGSVRLGWVRSRSESVRLTVIGRTVGEPVYGRCTVQVVVTLKGGYKK